MHEVLSDQEVARRLRKEHDLLQELGSRLKESLRFIPGTDRDAWLATLRDRYEHFRAHMYKRLALEEVGGFLKVVLERRPTLSAQVAHLKLEHEEILSLIDAVHAELKTAKSSDSALLNECALRIRHILSEVEHHEDHENMLVEFVFSQDLGGET